MSQFKVWLLMCIYTYIKNYNSHIFTGRPRTGALIGPLVFFFVCLCGCVSVFVCLVCRRDWS